MVDGQAGARGHPPPWLANAMYRPDQGSEEGPAGRVGEFPIKNSDWDPFGLWKSLFQYFHQMNRIHGFSGGAFENPEEKNQGSPFTF